jgi:hypothetical protein
MEQGVPKCRHIKFKRRSITQKKEYNWRFCCDLGTYVRLYIFGQNENYNTNLTVGIREVSRDVQKWTSLRRIFPYHLSVPFPVKEHGMPPVLHSMLKRSRTQKKIWEITNDVIISKSFFLIVFYLIMDQKGTSTL